MSKERETPERRDVEEYVKALTKDMDRRMEELRAQLETLQKRATKTVAERPMLALGVAFVAGMALGVALSKSSD